MADVLTGGREALLLLVFLGAARLQCSKRKNVRRSRR